jgi:hypothetical protein
MAIHFQCPYCDGNLEVADEGAGSDVACPICSRIITIPEKPSQFILTSDQRATKPHIKKAAISAAVWAAGLCGGFILGPLFIGLPGGAGISPEEIAKKLVAAVFLFPIIFVVVWLWGIFMKKGTAVQPSQQHSIDLESTTPAIPTPESPHAIQKEDLRAKKPGPWNYVWIGVGAFMLLFLFLPRAIRGTLESQYYLGAAFWIGVIIYCCIKISRAK